MQRFPKILKICSPLILSIFLFQPFEVQGQPGTSRLESSSSAGLHTTDEAGPLFLPAMQVCMSNQPSPFSLQIAALHLIQPLTTGAVYDVEADTAFITLTEALQDSGADWTRLYISWADIEPNQPQPGQDPVYNWDWYDGRIRRIVELGIKPFLTVGVAPEWAADTPCSPFYPERMDDFARFLTDLVNRYKQPPYNIRHWELINEPDGIAEDSWRYGWGCWGYDGEAYTSMLSAAYHAIKVADPSATVLMGGLAYDGFIEYFHLDPEVNFNRYFPDTVMQFGGGALIDALNIHYFPDYHREWERWDPSSEDRIRSWLPAPTCGVVSDGQGPEYYAGGIDIIAKANHFRNRMATCYGVDKPLWLTELASPGYPNDPASLANQARYVIAGHARALAAGIHNITWYALVTLDGFEQGLLDQDWNPKPAFVAYQTLTRELDGYLYKQTILGSPWELYSRPEYEAYIFNHCDDEKTVVWANNDLGSASFAFAPATQVRVVDRMGNETLVSDGHPADIDGPGNRSIRLLLSQDPIFVQITAR
jgi:hypothetical protein